MSKQIDNTYINPESLLIKELVNEISKNMISKNDIIINLLKWFDNNISYSRLNSPFFPLQRSDIDVLNMKSGTCGDYANLIVSVLINLGIPAKYAYIEIDCFDNQQDHICTAAYINNSWKLIDATLPYRKWMGFDCKHKKYVLLDVQEFYMKLKSEEENYINIAKKLGRDELAGILYAPWIHCETAYENKNRLDSVFYLLVFNSKEEYCLYIYYLIYSSKDGKSPIRIIVREGKAVIQFSTQSSKEIWDENQWSIEYDIENSPQKCKLEEFYRLCNMYNKVLKEIQQIIDKLRY